MSNDVANQVKFIHAHQIAKNTTAKWMRPSHTWSSVREWCSWTAAVLIAMTKTRSKNSSRLDAARCGSCASRGRMGRSRKREWCGVDADVIAPE